MFRFIKDDIVRFVCTMITHFHRIHRNIVCVCVCVLVNMNDYDIECNDLWANVVNPQFMLLSIPSNRFRVFVFFAPNSPDTQYSEIDFFLLCLFTSNTLYFNHLQELLKRTERFSCCECIEE